MVRPVVLPRDLPALLRLETLLFPDHSWGERLLQHQLEQGRGWVASLDDSGANAYALARDDGPIIDITRLGVAPEWHRRGLGSQLLKAVIGIGKDTMLTVEKRNAVALKLYLAHGFRIAGQLTGAQAWHEGGAWVMRRSRHIVRAENSAPHAHR